MRIVVFIGMLAVAVSAASAEPVTRSQIEDLKKGTGRTDLNPHQQNSQRTPQDPSGPLHTTAGGFPASPPSSGYTIIRDRTEIVTKSKLLRMDNIGIVVESLDDAISFFTELGLTLEVRAMVEGEWAGRVTGLGNQRVEIAMMVTPDGHNRLELSRFLAPSVVADHRNAPVNALGYLRAMFTVSDIDETLTRLRKRGAQLVGEVFQYEDSYRLCYIRGPEGLLIGLAEPIGSNR
jgi:catechol 2,3-dioxygenase-like lactoylglutathione lyase family enzyme